jgi:aquaporin Z
MKNYLTEAIGTFFLVLTIGLTVLGGTQFAPLAIGASLMIMVYMGGHISGGHYNPAVTLAVCVRGKLDGKELVPYWIFQVLGAFVASLIVYILLQKPFALSPAETTGTFGALLTEFLFTFALALVVLNSTTAQKTAGNSFYGLAIGFTVAVGAFAGGPISGGAFNPAVGTGPIVMHALAGAGFPLGNLLTYWIGPLVGGAVAAIIFKIQNPDDV